MNERKVVRLLGLFLGISYGIGGPVAALLELRAATLSSRFDLPPSLILSVAVFQTISALAILARRNRIVAALALTAISIGAIASHVRIGSPQTSIAAVAYTLVQLWYVRELLRGRQSA